MTQTTRVLITGGNRGLGYAYAQSLLSSSKGHDYKIYITARSAAQAKTAAEKLDPNKVKGFGCDVENEQDIAQLVKDVEQDGGLDVLINNAGVALDSYIQNGSMTVSSAWQKSYSINVTSTHILTTALVPLLLQSKSPRIIFISSMVGSVTNQSKGVIPGMDDLRPAGWPKPAGFNPTSYRSTKAAFNMMSREWYRTLHNDGVKVYILAMGGYATELGGQDPEQAKQGGKPGPEVAGEWVRGFVEGEHEGEEGKYMAIHGEQPW